MDRIIAYISAPRWVLNWPDTFCLTLIFRMALSEALSGGTSGDKINWDIEVLASGHFYVEIYYTCPTADTGSVFTLSSGNSVLEGRITEAHDPPLIGMENDRLVRKESYIKDFKPMNLGIIYLEQGRET